MNNELRQKNKLFRNDIRKKQLEDYFCTIRKEISTQQLLQQEEKEKFGNQDVKLEMNEQVINHMLRGDIHQIYFIFGERQGISKMQALSEDTCLKLFQFLLQNISKQECVLILKLLIDAHFQLIFMSNCAVIQNRKWFIGQLFEQISQNIAKISKQNNEANKRQLKTILTIYLDCVLSLIAHGRIIGGGNYVSKTINQIFVLYRLWLGLIQLHQVPLFLVVLTINQIQTNFSAQSQFQVFLSQNMHVFKKLMDQITPDFKSRTVALPSLVIINSFVRNLIPNKQLCIKMFVLYLEKTQFVYQCIQSGTSFIKVESFCEMLDNLQMLFESLSQLVLPQHVGEIMRNTNFWNFAYLLLRVETQGIRKCMFNCIMYALHNMMVNSVRLDEQIQEELIFFLVQGLASRSIPMRITSLKITQMLVHSSENSPIILKHLYEYEISSTLSELSNHQNKQISNLSYLINIELNHKIIENFQNDIE